MKRTAEQISYNMQRIKNKDSVIELTLRKELWSRGIRYRKNVSSIYGHPDIAFLSKKIAVFVDSEFWHGYDWKTEKTILRVIEIFGFQKWREISQGTRK